ncbi:ABC transporter permease [Oscillospiraceae bacterium MB08-C2-2]|nr:ABC transporter permease [Oscillospiraceae bacterium MB08-C2-2]
MDVLHRSTKTQKAIAASISIGCFLILWQLVTTFTGLAQIMPTPVVVITRFIKGLYTKIGPYTILGHAFWSLSRVLIAYTVAAIAGIVLGLAMGWNKSIEAFCRPVFEMIRPIPPIAWIPLSILWLGLGEMTKYFLIFLAAFSNVTMNAYAGALAVDPVLVGAARMLGANKIQIFTKIVIPSSVPQIFAGLQIALSSSWATVVAAEMVRSSEGIGWMIFAGMETNNMPQILVGILAIGLIGFLLAIIMRGAETHLCAWNNKGV